jgi:L-ascorbate metabolism protein UlaG (beta-lactamase superfamily)
MRWPRLGLALAALAAAACYAPRVDIQRTYHPSDADMAITRIVHGSLILEFRGTRILVDPWYSPTPPLGPGETIGIAPDKLPSVRGILLTHKHSDHFDKQTLSALGDKSVRVVVPKGLGKRVEDLGYTDVVELEPWERSQIADVVVSSVPARHRAVENGYILQANGITTYLAGDTTFDPSLFWSILEGFPKIDVAILPIGGIRIVGRKLDMNPDEAARAFGLLKPDRVIPYHYALVGPFPLVYAPSEPEADFLEAMKERHPGKEGAVVRLVPGESWHYYK